MLLEEEVIWNTWKPSKKDVYFKKEEDGKKEKGQEAPFQNSNLTVVNCKLRCGIYGVGVVYIFSA